MLEICHVKKMSVPSPVATITTCGEVRSFLPLFMPLNRGLLAWTLYSANGCMDLSINLSHLHTNLWHPHVLFPVKPSLVCLEFVWVFLNGEHAFMIQHHPQPVATFAKILMVHTTTQCRLVHLAANAVVGVSEWF